MVNLNDKDSTTAINIDNDWRCIRLTNMSPYDKDYISLTYDDDDWEHIQLPHYDEKKTQKFTSTCVSYWYRKRFDLRKKFDPHQQIYLHFESISNTNEPDDESDVKIPGITVW
ncbi:unnamed protein product, partial [Adineta steineri]